jgi:hypothetical protein
MKLRITLSILAMLLVSLFISLGTVRKSPRQKRLLKRESKR